jgi:hypothetical protein
MVRKTSDFEFRQQASLSQRLGFQKETAILQKLSGSDPEISKSIAILSFLTEQQIIEERSSSFVLGLLDALRLAAFATSDKTNEITKMGFMLPAQEIRVIDE